MTDVQVAVGVGLVEAGQHVLVEIENPLLVDPGPCIEPQLHVPIDVNRCLSDLEQQQDIRGTRMS
jgi:hypothetical protein